jgi:dihydrofolate reductase
MKRFREITLSENKTNVVIMGRKTWESLNCVPLVGRINIVVSNTLTQDWEMEPYFDLANKYGFRVVSLIIENRHGGTNIHGVPEEKIQAMRDRFEISL